MSVTTPTSTTVTFGNPSPQMQIVQDDGSTISQPAAHLSVSVTSVEMWEGFDNSDGVAATLATDNERMLTMIARTLSDTDQHYAIGVYELEQIVAVHTGGLAPDWVASSDSAFQAVLATHFNCPQGDPSMLLTSVGRDALHAQHLSTSGPPATFNYVALTASTVAPASGDTTLTGEITSAGGGLLRAQATYAHTAGTNTTTLTKTYTANGSDALPVTIAQIGVFNATSSGTLAYHTALSATATLSSIGDSLSVTETVTAG
jgi:hypothetical protein